MKTKILAGLLLAGSTVFAAPRVSFGIGFGAPAPVVVEAVPPCPGPGYVFLNGYWQLPAAPRVWHGDYYRSAPARFDRHVEHFRR